MLGIVSSGRNKERHMYPGAMNSLGREGDTQCPLNK